ncbi:transglutaminase-like domain-containing protein [Dethiobacter alkaliphilus]|uniref:Transglutaminase domain protein n=1 Tax=Dethiobacter alkaliphilus AHT 1 TaxID=555088 RepID=C0GCB5_DETAL|nr:transglutaminase-like domain-containing protein [Dethiobacter alkaliphilus]EEG78850.1 transglutaminase domain protein [Dethiobacter alkaliphilus AHT 1]
MKNVIEMLEKHPAVRFGLPVVAVVGCTLLFLFGISYLGSSYTFIAIGVLLLLAGYFCGWKVLGGIVTLSLALILVAGPYLVVPRVQWAGAAGAPSQLLYHRPDDPGPAQLRAEYSLDDVTRGIEDEFERVAALAGWVNSRWSHSGSNMPLSSNPLDILREADEGASFRCVEYSVVMVGASQAMGMPARVMGLKTSHAATARLGAGHVVAEVWLDDYQKWVVADPQLGYVFRADGVPLSAVELGEALARGPGTVEVLSAEGPVGWLQKTPYLLFMGPYLFHFDTQYDQRVFLPEDERKKGGLMLVPEGAPDLKKFQGQPLFNNFDYTSSVDTFYVAPEIALTDL